MSITPILQFGTSRFLQAHADLFLSEAMPGTRPVTVVQTSGDPSRTKRLHALAEGYEVHVRGIEDGQQVDRATRVDSIARGLTFAPDMAEITRIVAEEAQVILSNTADAGFKPRAEDTGPTLDPAMSYPAKLAHLLRARFEAGGKAPQIMPTELVQDNGTVLKGLVLEVAQRMDARYRDWLAEEVIWVNSLVDRIVSEPLEPAGAVAEPYALWAIEDGPGVSAPCDHPSVQVVSDLGLIERKKLFVLNLGHTWLVSRWLEEGRSPDFVREVMADPDRTAALRGLYEQEVRPGFEAAGETGGLDDYISITLDRFANPFLDHRIADIAQNHGEKLRRRIGAFVDWARARGDTSPKPRLEAALKGEDA
ncbi:D-mannonate oxidoreductase [Allosediminivita pacifica]|uniref:Tagaturonate reductase n=1 Tax=Allosediminivita pacifica TaxID=1267769 RepID=A0A2T6AQ14_9RHOB|nr:D-mannonate oxidoreductase [Allosediminivita pacifica]PTX45914.1 tagaturonate reductase [Allosediminivita pacifica]GGB19139.1 D-mannonate oxidoreductase [Allosediminivita pacifica]